MIVPTQIVFSAVPEAGVFSYTGTDWNLKTNSTTYVNLATGATNPGASPSDMVVYYPTAALCFGK